MALNNVSNLLGEPEPHQYIFESECDNEEYIKLPPIERWITYIATNPDSKKSAYSDGRQFSINASDRFTELSDCDGSGITGNNNLIHDVYSTLFGWNKGEDTFGRVEGFECSFGGDTINSMFCPLVDIAGDSIKGIPKNPAMYRFSKNNLIDYFAQKGTREEFISVLQRTCGLIGYLNSYHTIGNFTLVPAGFNGYRGLNLRDYWDDSLRYLMENGFVNNEKDTQGFRKDSFFRYVNYFFLWDYTDSGQPKCINPRKTQSSFFTIATRYILRRGVFMTAMLRLNAFLGKEKYTEMRNVVFRKSDGVYHGYDEVIDEIKKCLAINNEAEVILEKCRDEINRIV